MKLFYQFLLIFYSFLKLLIITFKQAEKAPAPDDVYWENISQGLRHPVKKWFHRLLTLLVNFGLILVALICLFFVNDYKRRIKKSDDFKEFQNNDLALYGLAFLSGIIIFIINMVNKYIVNQLSNWEYRQTKTHLSISRGNKIFFVQLFNTAGIYVLLYLIKYNDEMWLAGGILQDVMITHIQLAIFNPLSNIIFNFIKYLGRYLCIPYGKRAKKNTPEEKELVNSVLEKLQGYEFNISQEYANTLFLLFSVSFYGPLMPFLYIVGFLALFLQYWTDKYHVVKRYRIPNTISAEINDSLYFILQYMPLVQILSFWFWIYILKFDVNQNYIYYGIVTSSLIIIIPSKFIPRVFCKLNVSMKEQDDITYNDALMRGQFKKFYDWFNPLTHQESVTKYEKILSNQKLSKELMKGLNEALRFGDSPMGNTQMIKQQSQQYLQQIPQIKQIQEQKSKENLYKNIKLDGIQQQQFNPQPINMYLPNSRNQTPKNMTLQNNDGKTRSSVFQIPLVIQAQNYSDNSQESGASQITNPNGNQLNEEEFFSSVSERQNFQSQYFTNIGKENQIVANKYLQNVNIELNPISRDTTNSQFDIRTEPKENSSVFVQPTIKLSSQSSNNKNHYVIPQQYIQKFINANQQDL